MNFFPDSWNLTPNFWKVGIELYDAEMSAKIFTIPREIRLESEKYQGFNHDKKL